MSDISCRRLAGLVAVVTGGASGIGKATARRLATEGASVVIADVQEQVALEVAQAIVAEGGIAAAVTCDVANEESVKKLFEQADERFSRVDILANIAGVIGEAQPIDELNVEEYERVTSVNLLGTLLCIKHAASRMKRQRFGRIVNISSMVVTRPQSLYLNSYTASKGGVAAMNGQLVLELSSHGITINAVAPGIIDTPMLQLRGKKFIEQRNALIPVGRFGRPEDIAAAIAFLVSEDGSYMNGQTLLMDGGITAVTGYNLL